MKTEKRPKYDRDLMERAMIRCTQVKYIDGYSESVWKSLAVKSLRIGWAIGLEQAAKRLSPGTMEAMLLCGLFEDTFPALPEIQNAVAEVRRGDYRALCERETHHGRGYTDRFCDLEKQAVDMAFNHKPELWADAKTLKLWLPPRSLNCYWTWRQLNPQDGGILRPLDETPWTGMPLAMLDGHTYEGKVLGQRVTVLSGHYFNHRKIGQRVMAEGWGPLRAEVHSALATPKGNDAEPDCLF